MNTFNPLGDSFEEAVKKVVQEKFPYLSTTGTFRSFEQKGTPDVGTYIEPYEGGVTDGKRYIIWGTTKAGSIGRVVGP